ncbi:hypothetical protein QBC46DRAFT_397767 [Diplogelasinospora grovesii]|uniref:NmrA-like domain-containing protein n=1 Tax=Diplogelasinospora grovesii TaxID=303347 RepID=A0AAN6S0B0_9PEZI|nr:hypothetical protein QBC46DRAFT_397767 [Diplogelasinospora grovesii]
MIGTPSCVDNVLHVRERLSLPFNGLIDIYCAFGVSRESDLVDNTRFLFGCDQLWDVLLSKLNRTLSIIPSKIPTISTVPSRHHYSTAIVDYSLFHSSIKKFSCSPEVSITIIIMSTTRNILVVGATGQQGGAVVRALASPRVPSGDPPINILALTRNPDSPKAKSLLESHKDDDVLLSLVKGDSSNPASIFDSRPSGSVHGVFIVTTPGKISEESQAIPLIDAAINHGVRRIVFSSVDRRGDQESWDNPCPEIKHFHSKHKIELHLRDKASQEGVSWAVLRPTAFLENFSPGFFGSMFTAIWHSALSPERKLQLVSVRDIGIFAAKALTEDEQKWSGRAVGLAGDELTLDEAREVFKRVTGKKLPQTYTILARLLMWMVPDMGNMFRWFETQGYGVDIAERRKEVPEMLDFEGWLKQSNWMNQ